MLKVTARSSEKGRKELDIEAPAERVDAEIEKALWRYSRSVELPGFRRGKVPVRIIKARLGKVIEEEVLQDLLPKLYEEARKSEGIEPVTPATIDSVEYKPGEFLRFTASVEVQPDIQISNYKGLQLTKIVRKVKEEDVERYLEDLQTRNAEEKSVDRPARMGDILLVDLQSLALSGIPILGTKVEDRLIEIGTQNSPSPDLDVQLVDMRRGEEKNLRFTYRRDLDNPDLAGKEAAFWIKVKEIRERNLPPIDDEFAKDMGPYQTLEELKESIRQNIQEQLDRYSISELRAEIINHLISTNQFDPPESMVENYLKAVLEEAKKNSGKPIDEQTIKEDARSTVIRRIKSYLLIETVAKSEGIQVSDDEVEDYIRQLASEHPLNAEDISQSLHKDNQFEKIKSDLLEEKAFNFLIENAKIQEVGA